MIRIIYLALVLLLSQQIWCQDLTQEKSSAEIEKGIHTPTKSNSLEKLNAIVSLNKAKKNNNTLDILKAYKKLAELNYPTQLCVQYADSILYVSGKKINKYVVIAHIKKGAVFYEQGNYPKALDEYLIALKYANKINSTDKAQILKFNIALLKNDMGERKEAQAIFKKYLNHIKNNYTSGDDNDDNDKNYNKGLYGLADSYLYDNKLDSAEIIINEGLSFSLSKKDSAYYSFFKLNSGINNYFKKDYQLAIDNLKTAKEILIKDKHESTRVALCDYYIGKSLVNLNANDESLSYFLSVDSILNINKDVSSELLDSYKYLIADSKQKGDLKGQIKYINTLIKYDSILDTNYKYLKNTIEKEYDTPELILEKEVLISKLEKENYFSGIKIFVLIVFLILLSLTLVLIIRRSALNKKRFNEIIKELQKNKEKPKTINIEKATTAASTGTGLSETIVEQILKSLEKFETSEKFTKKNYTLTSLAKLLNTNSAYLSKVINATKQTNFSHYLNNIRIEYAIKKLTTDKRFRLFTIKAIAEGSGFNTAQSFSVAFKNKTGIYPSYFIKKLSNEDL